MYQDINGVKVFYQTAGKGAPLLMLHGWGVSGETFHPLFMRLAAQREVRVLDFPGFGQSPPPPEVWGTREYADMVCGLLDAWGWQRPDILAHSFGARVATRLASAHPDRVGKMLFTGAAGIRKATRVPLGKRIVSKAGKLAGMFGPPGQWIKKRLYSRIGSADYQAAGAMRPILVKTVNEDLTGLYPSIKNETLLVWGADDPATPLEDGKTMADLLPAARLEVIPGAGHYAFIDRPEEFYRQAAPFLGVQE